MKSRSIIFALCAALLALPLWRAAAQPRQGPPSPDEIKAMARELQEKQRERERLSERKELIPLEDISSRPTFASDPNFAYLRLTNQMALLRAIWTLLPETASDGAKSPAPLIVPLTFRGDQWLRLEPGPWLVQLETGDPGSDLALTMAPRSIELKAGRSYTLDMTNQVEQQLRKVLDKMAHPIPSETPAGGASAETPAP